MGKFQRKGHQDNKPMDSDDDESVDEQNEQIVETEEEEDGDNANDDMDEEQEDGSEQEVEDDEQDQEEIQGEVNTTERPVKQKKVHKLSLTETTHFNEKLKKRGVIYIARVPPRMTPTKVKALLSEFGEVTRIYLVEEDPTVRKRRKKEHGKSGGKRYVEGWIEMTNKRKAKHIAQSLNNTPISNHKRNPHYGRFPHVIEIPWTFETDCGKSGRELIAQISLCFLGDLWNLKYLNKFKWSHLTEKVAYERRVREQKLRVEMMQARRENAAFVQMVETGKKLDKIEERKRKRGELDPVIAGTDTTSSKRHKHRQNKVLEEGSNKAAKRALLGGLV